jgi:hypothetical protein
MQLKLSGLGLLPLALLLLPHSALAWGPEWGGGGYGYGDQGYGGVGYCGAYCAGQADGQYDQQNNLPWNPVGQCLPCHSPDYWQNFRQGYDSVYQQQEQQSTQGAAINIYGNNYGTASIGQSNTQGQSMNPLQQLGHVVCGLVNCNSNQPTQAYAQPYGGYQNPDP